MRRFAVIGSPIQHSLSPLLHTAAYKHHGLSDCWYTPNGIEINVHNAADFWANEAKDFSGFSVTMPLKPWAFQVADECDETTTLLGVANTLLRTDSGWRAENHDVYGVVAAVTPHLKRLREDATVCVLGAGGTARSIIAALGQLGFKHVVLCARRSEAVAELSELAEKVGLMTASLPWQHRADIVDFDFLLSTLPAPGASELVSYLQGEGAHFNADSLLFDAIYSPWPAPLTGYANPVQTISGLEMLVHQAVGQLKVMTGATDIDADYLLRLALKQVDA